MAPRTACVRGMTSRGKIKVPDLLGFAGLPPGEVPALPLPVHIAEKVHAYTRRPVSRIRFVAWRT